MRGKGRGRERRGRGSMAYGRVMYIHMGVYNYGSVVYCTVNSNKVAESREMCFLTCTCAASV